MSISALVLFGSKARGDEGPNSDVDFLLITSDDKPRHASVSKVSLSFYPYSDMLRRASVGDLFVLHIILEGKVIHDPDHRVDLIKAAFRKKDTYAEETSAATDLAWLIAKFGQQFDRALTAKRITWCVRTALIARSVEIGAPVFSPNELMKMAPIAEIGALIKQKDHPIDASSFDNLKKFLIWGGFSDPCRSATSPDNYQRRFVSSENSVGRHFMKANTRLQEIDEYTA